ncbi:MAG TPA: hypothetical protein VMB35_05960 [Methanomicrobiales archaeon]|nr:hypothetical protein [Methanomicrobiales archaeon]
MRPSTNTDMRVVILILALALGTIPMAVSAAVFTDDFSSGFGNWNLYGSPLPVILPSFGGRTGVFDNNGDATCDSGIATKNTFFFPNGAVISSDVYLAVTDWSGCWASSEVSITRDRDPYQTPSCPGEGYYDGASIRLAGIGDACSASLSQYRRHAYVQCSILAEDRTSEGNGYSFVADGYINGWHTLKMVVEPDRHVSCFIDDSLVYRTQKKLDPQVLTDKRVQLGRRSSGVLGKAYHDNIMVDDNMAFATPGITPAGSPAPNAVSNSSRVPLASGIVPPQYLPATAVASGIGLAAAGAAASGMSGFAGGSAGGTTTSPGGSAPGGARPVGWLSRQVERLKDVLPAFFRARTLAVIGAKETEVRKLEPVLRPPVFLGLSARELATIGVSVTLYAGAFVIAGRLQTGLQSVALFLAMGIFAVICHEFVTIRLARHHSVRSEFRFWGLGTGILVGTSAVFGLAFGTPSRTLLKGLEALRPNEEIAIMAAGPLVNLLFAGVSFLMMPCGGIIGLAGAVGFPVNILNAVFSMIPVRPLKGRVIYGNNRLAWAAIFLPIIALYSIAYLVP